MAQRWLEALRGRDLDRMMASYENDVVVFDAMGALQHVGIDAYRETWQARLEKLEGPIETEVRDLAIRAGDGVAFGHMLVRVTALQPRAGHDAGWLGWVGAWMRWSGVWRKIDGAWLVVHEHLSVPFDPVTGEIVLEHSGCP